MKNLKNNKKGFTLIELLAVIVILAILVAVAIPATMKYLNQARTGTFADQASEAVQQVRNDMTISNINATTIYYDLENINKLLEKQISSSPFGGTFSSTSYVKASYNSTTAKYEYTVCFDDGKYVLTGSESDLTAGNVSAIDTTHTACAAIPSGSTIAVVNGISATTTSIK